MNFRINYTREPTPGAKIRQQLESRHHNIREGFGVSSDRFNDSEFLTSAPGVGKYCVVPSEGSLLLNSPSISKRGYVGGFASKSPQLSVYKDSGVPGPSAYSLERTSISSAGKSGGSPLRSAAFAGQPQNRVPFPSPSNVPGPCAYQSHLCMPGPGQYGSRSSGSEAKGDVQWTKSTYVRFCDIGKDNHVPGPQRYFSDQEEERKSLRSAGNYRGMYKVKLFQRGCPESTFGADKDRFKNSFVGRLDVAASMPGPGQYYHDLDHLKRVSSAANNIIQSEHSPPQGFGRTNSPKENRPRTGNSGFV